MCRSFLTSSGRWELLDCIHVGVCGCTFLTGQSDTSDYFCVLFCFFSFFDELASSDFSQTGVMNLLIWTKSERLNLSTSDVRLYSDLNLLSWNDLITSSPSVRRFFVFPTMNTLWISPVPANHTEWSEANSRQITDTKGTLDYYANCYPVQKKKTWDHLEPNLVAILAWNLHQDFICSTVQSSVRSWRGNMLFYTSFFSSNNFHRLACLVVSAVTIFL